MSFEEAYDAWMRSLEQGEGRYTLDVGSIYSDGRDSLNKEYRRLVAMGPRILPSIIERMSRDRDSWRLAGVVRKISGDRRLVTFGRQQDKTRPGLFLRFWKSVLERTETDCKAALRRWDEARKGIRYTEEMVLSREITYVDAHTGEVASRVEKTELGEAFDDFAGLGIGALPFLVSRLRGGQHDLLPIARHLTKYRASAGGATIKERAENFIKWWSANSQAWLIPVGLLRQKCRSLTIRGTGTINREQKTEDGH